MPGAAGAPRDGPHLGGWVKLPGEVAFERMLAGWAGVARYSFRMSRED